jgi:hypothetical protein
MREASDAAEYGDTNESSTAADKRRRQLNRAAAYELHSKYRPEELTRAARSKFLSRFEREIREEFGALPTDELQRRAEQRKRAYFTRLSVLAADARRGKARKR